MDKTINTIQIDNTLDTKMLMKFAEMINSNATQEEKYEFARANGFLTGQQLRLYLSGAIELLKLQDGLWKTKTSLSCEEKLEQLKEIEKQEVFLSKVKKNGDYIFYMRTLGKHDVTPFGVDIVNISLEELAELI